MVEELVTIDTILGWFKDSIEKKCPIGQDQWLDGASKLTILSEEIDDKLSEMDAVMAERERIAVEEGEPAAKAKIIKTGAIDYKEYLKLKAKRKRIDRHIEIAKKREKHPDF